MRTLLLLGLLFAAGCLAFPFLWSYGRTAGEGRWSDRTWWYGGELPDGATARLDAEVTDGQLRINWRGACGEDVILYWSDTRHRFQEIDSRLLRQFFKSFLQFWDQPRGISRALTLNWLPCMAFMAALWFLLLGTQASVGAGRAARMLGTTLAGLVPCLTVLLLAVVTKVGVILWWVPPAVTETLSGASFVLFFMFPLLQLRYGISCPVARWRVTAFTGAYALILYFMLSAVVHLRPLYGWL